MGTFYTNTSLTSAPPGTPEIPPRTTMRVSYRPDGSLVIREAWLALRIATLLGAALILALVVPPCLGGTDCHRRELIGGLIAALLFSGIGALLPDLTFVFDAAATVVRWKRRRLLTSAAGEVPFADIIDVTCRATTEGDLDSRFPRTEYRLALVTKSGDLFLSSTRSLARGDFSGIAEQVNAVLRSAGDRTGDR
jgi:hypothetical protein